MHCYLMVSLTRTEALALMLSLAGREDAPVVKLKQELATLLETIGVPREEWDAHA